MTEPAELDDSAIERLLAGDVAPAELPPEWAPVAGLLRAARDVAPGEAPDADLLEALTAATRGGRVHRRIGLGLGITAALVMTGSGVAAANGALPDPVQGVVHDVAAVVGVHVPQSHHAPQGPPTTGGSQDGPGHGRSDDAPGRPDEPGQPDDPGRSDEAPGHLDDEAEGEAEGDHGRPDVPGRSEDAPGHQDDTASTPDTASTASTPTTTATPPVSNGNGTAGGNANGNANGRGDEE